jgi:hypothetical protein
VIEWKNDNHHRHVIARLKFLNAVKQHRFSRDPAKLFELASADASPAASSNDHDADVSRH